MGAAGWGLFLLEGKTMAASIYEMESGVQCAILDAITSGVGFTPDKLYKYSSSWVDHKTQEAMVRVYGPGLDEFSGDGIRVKF